MKRKELLAQFPDSDSEEEEEETIGSDTQADAKNEEDQNENVDEEEIDLSSLEGVKCRAPHFIAGNFKIFFAKPGLNS